jgi:hypothetical protein
MLKDWPKVYKKLEKMRGITLEERVLLAQGLAATPEENLERHDSLLRSLGLYSHWDRKKLGFKL